MVTTWLTDITYEIQNQANQNMKIVYFDRLKKTTLNLVNVHQSEKEKVPKFLSKSDSDFEQVAHLSRND